jgi:Ca2+-binding RTX toxin-like protein
MYDYDFNHRADYTDGASDTFVGGDGADWAYGGGGNDTYDMGAGADYVYSGPGDDVIKGGDGDDQLRGGAGKDVIEGEAGDDNIWGDDGDDLLKGGTGIKGLCTIWGGLGNDTIYNAQEGGNVYTGDGSGVNDKDTGPNTVYGYAGDQNFYTGSNGPDVMHLGSGNDIVYGYAGDDVIELGDGKNTAHGDAGNDTITGGKDADVIYGDAGDDTLSGAAGRDILEGDAGNDTLSGGPDDDSLEGGAGDDVMDGGLHADRFDGQDGFDTVTYAGRTEPITVKENGNFTDGGTADISSRPGYENYRDYVNYDVERIVGGSGNDSISIGATARKGTATLEGGPGNDTLVTRSPSTVPTTLVGGPGDDTLQGGDGADVFVQGSAPDGADDVRGGGGDDTVDYSRRPANTAYVTLDDVANDGGVGERDNIHKDVEKALGAVGGVRPTPKASVGAARVNEGAAGAKTAAKVAVTLSSATDVAVKVPWSVVSGTATAGKDFVAASGAVTIPAGATSAQFAVTVLGDNTDEVDEYATVKLGSPTGATLGTSSSRLTIADDDAAPKVSIRSAAVAEGKAGRKTPLTFTVNLSAASGKTVTVTVTTSNGSAKAGSDYVARSATVTFSPGQTSKAFTVTVLGDSKREPNETLTAALSKPVNATLGTYRATGTIRNDD